MTKFEAYVVMMRVPLQILYSQINPLLFLIVLKPFFQFLVKVPKFLFLTDKNRPKTAKMKSRNISKFDVDLRMKLTFLILAQICVLSSVIFASISSTGYASGVTNSLIEISEELEEKLKNNASSLDELKDDLTNQLEALTNKSKDLEENIDSLRSGNGQLKEQVTVLIHEKEKMKRR